MEESLEQQHRNIHLTVKQRLEEVSGEGTPQFVQPYLQLPAEQLQAIHDFKPVSAETAQAARALLGQAEDCAALPAFLQDLLSSPAEQTIAQLLHYYTTRKILQAVAAQRVAQHFPDA